MDVINALLPLQSILATEYQRIEKERRLMKRLAHKARREQEAGLTSSNISVEL